MADRLPLDQSVCTDTVVQSDSSLSCPPSPSVAASPQWTVRPKEPKGFTPFVAFCFTTNYVLGTGFLTIPWAFVQGGLALSAVLLMVVSVLADAAMGYVLESMARAEAMLDERMKWIRVPPGHVGAAAAAKAVAGKETEAQDDAAGGKYGMVYSPILPGAGTTTPTMTTSYHGGTSGANRDDATSTDNDDVEMLNYTARPLASTGRSYGATGSAGNLASALLPGSRPVSVPGTPRRGVNLGGAIGGGNAAGASTKNTPGAARRAFQGRKLVLRRSPDYIVRHRKFEVNALCRVFLGKNWTNAYMFFLGLYVYCTLWAYASVFSSAMARRFAIGLMGESTSYVLYAVAFGSVVVPMSCLELDEQIVVQVFLAGCRFLMVFLMVTTSGTCAREASPIVTHDNTTGVVGHGDTDDNDHGSNGAATIPPMLFRPSGIHMMLPILVFATIYHHSIPGLAHPVNDKRNLTSIFRSTTIFTGVAYVFIGSVLSWNFGERMEQSANLNWRAFTAGTGRVNDDGIVVDVAWWAKAIELYVVCFPAIDVLSAFPLNAITLGNNMLSSYYGRRIHEVESNRSIRIRFRILASVPPIILAILVRDLGTITDYAGTTGFVLTFSFPAQLYIQGRKLATKKHFSYRTYYSTYASSNAVAYVICAFGLSMLVFVIVSQMIS